jgi:nitronate monooxygenase
VGSLQFIRAQIYSNFNSRFVNWNKLLCERSKNSISSVELVSTASNADGLGGYGAYTLSPQSIFDIDLELKAATNKPYNINAWESDSDAPNGAVSYGNFERPKTLFKPYFDEAGLRP